MKTQNDNQHALTVSDLMKRWKCGQKAVLEAIHRGDLHAFKVGKRAYRVTVREVERYEQTKAQKRAAGVVTHVAPVDRRFGATYRKGPSARHQAARPPGKRTIGLRASIQQHCGFDPGPLPFLPDAYELEPTAQTIVLFEVEVTSSIGKRKREKLGRFHELMEAHGWRVRLFSGDQNAQYTELDPRTCELTDAARAQVVAALEKRAS